MVEEDADVLLGWKVMAETRRQYAQLVTDGYEPDHVLVSSRYREAIARSWALIVHGNDQEPYWTPVTVRLAILIVFSPDLPDVHVPTNETGQRSYLRRESGVILLTLSN